MTTGKTTAVTRWTFVGKVISLLFNMLSRLVLTFLPRSKRLLISSLQSPSEVILEIKNIKSVTISTVSPSICHEVVGPDAMILVLWMLSFKSTFSLSPFTFIMRQVLGPGALGRPRGIGWRGRCEGGSGWGIHVTPWLIHVNVWQKPLQYCKVISPQLIKINGKKNEALYFFFAFCHKGGVICISEVIEISPPILIPACASSSPAFLMMYSAYKLNKQGDNTQPWHTPFPNLEPVCCSMFSSSCLLLLDLHTDFSEGRSGGLIFLSL